MTQPGFERLGSAALSREGLAVVVDGPALGLAVPLVRHLVGHPHREHTPLVAAQEVGVGKRLHQVPHKVPTQELDTGIYI